MAAQGSRMRRGDALVEAVRRRTRTEGRREEVQGLVLPLDSPVKKGTTPAKRVSDTNASRSEKSGKTDKSKAERKQTPNAASALQPRQQTPHPLKPVFAGLLSVYTMMRRRNKQITFSSIKDAVEQASHRRFHIADLRLLARVVPDIVSLEEMPRVTTGSGKGYNDGDDMIVRVTLPKGGAGVAMEAFHGAAYGMEKRVLVESTPTGDINVNDGARTPETKKRKKNPRIRSVLQSPTSRRLSDLVHVCDRGAPTSMKCTDTPARSSLRTPIAPIAPIQDNEELYTRTLSGVISMESLQRLERNEHHHMALSSAEAKAARHERATIASLPDILQRLMAVCGRKGPKVMELGAVCDTLRGGGLELASREDVEARVRRLAVHAPEFLKIERGRGGIEEVWVVNPKGFDIRLCMNRLRQL